MFLLPTIDLDEAENRVWNASLDGRAIHSFLLWIEPSNNLRSARVLPGISQHLPVWPLVDAASRVRPLGRGLIALAECAADGPPAVELDGLDWAPALLPLDDGLRLAVFESAAEPAAESAAGGSRRLRPGRPAVREATRAALGLLDSVGLRYVVDLAIGVLVHADLPLPHPAAERPDLSWLVDAPHDPVDLAELLLREGARCWIGQWLRTEEAVGVRSEPVTAEDRDWLVAVLADSFVFQLYDRLTVRDPHGPAAAARRRQETYDRLFGLREELPDRLGRSTGFAVVSELVGTTYPCWNRRQFATKSPFDYMREIRPLTDAEKAAHLERWSVPEAVR
jgi:hypothetical protein